MIFKHLAYNINYHRRLSRKLNDKSLSAKAYWTILKTVYNNKKIPIIPPILIDNQLVTDFSEKA